MTTTITVEIHKIILLRRFLFLRAIQCETPNNTTVININRSLYFEMVPTEASPTPLRPSDAKNNGPNQLIQAKKAVTTDPRLDSLSFKKTPP